ncbi:hypothetical protein BH11BAC2_BH11BAC2_24600 [soil metagenome]
MKRRSYTFHPRINILIIILLLIYSGVNAQQELSSVPDLREYKNSEEIGGIRLDLSKDLKEQLIPVDSLIEIATNYNPEIKSQQSLVQAGEEQVKLGRREWQNGVSLTFNQNLGNQTLLYNTNLEPVGAQSQSQTTGYRLGFNVSLPLYLLSGRTSRINVFQKELEVRKETGEKLKLDLSRQVIFEYNNMLSTHQMLLIASNSRSTSRMLMDMATQQFKQGDITIADYSSVMSIATKSESDYEIAKRDFYSWYLQFEKLLGARLDTLTRKK